MRCARSLVALSCLALLAPGCGEQGPDRFPLSGSVSFEGAPVAEGSIRFVPEEKGKQPEGAVIRDGKYNATLTAGKKQVIIEAFRPKEGQSNVPQRPGGVPLRSSAVDVEMYIPEKYNTKTTLSVEAGPETSTKNFELVP
jgi:hypothetical protein